MAPVAAPARPLSLKRAQRVATSFVRELAAQTAQPDYGVGLCKRRTRHRTTCEAQTSGDIQSATGPAVHLCNFRVVVTLRAKRVRAAQTRLHCMTLQDY